MGYEKFYHIYHIYHGPVVQGDHAQVSYGAQALPNPQLPLMDTSTDQILGEIPDHNQHYIERPAIDEKLKNHLLKDKRVIAVSIAGLPGMGKSKYCINFAYNQSKQYDKVIFLPGEKSRFQACFNKIIDPISTSLTLNTTECQNYYISLEEAGHRRILIIIDDVINLEDIKNFLPFNFRGRSCQFHLIIISQKAYNELKVINIAGFTSDEIKQIASHFQLEESPADIERICEALHNYPLAIITAINTIKSCAFSINEFLKKLYQYEYTAYDNKALATLCPTYPCPDYPTYLKSTLNSLDRTFGVLFNHIRINFPDAFELLGYLCVLNNAPIPKNFLVKLMPDIDTQAALDFLLGLHLISYHRKSATLTIHQLACLCYKQLYAPSYINKSYKVQRAINSELIAVVNEYESFELTNNYQWHRVSFLVDHALLVRSKIVYSVDTAEEANMLCNAFYLVGLYHTCQHNPEGVALAILHFRGALETGDNFCYTGKLFNGRNYESGIHHLEGMLQSRLKDDNGYNEAISMSGGIFGRSARTGKYYFAEEVSLLSRVNKELSSPVGTSTEATIDSQALGTKKI